MIVTPSNRWRSVGVSRSRSAPSLLRAVAIFPSACSDPYSFGQIRSLQYTGHVCDSAAHSPNINDIFTAG